MPIRTQPIYPGEIYHAYNRSVAKKTIFHDENDYGRFLLRAAEYKELFPIDLLAYCIMPNHFHLLIREPNPDTLNIEHRPQNKKTVSKTLSEQFLHRLLSSYGRYYTTRYSEHSGHVFQGNYKAKRVDPKSSIEMLFAYIHDNPVRAGLVQHPADWPHSSYLSLTSKKPDALITRDDKLSDLNHQKIWERFARDRQKVYPHITTIR